MAFRHIRFPSEPPSEALRLNSLAFRLRSGLASILPAHSGYPVSFMTISARLMGLGCNRTLRAFLRSTTTKFGHFSVFRQYPEAFRFTFHRQTSTLVFALPLDRFSDALDFVLASHPIFSFGSSFTSSLRQQQMESSLLATRVRAYRERLTTQLSPSPRPET